MFVNTQYFSEAAKLKSKQGVYCKAPYGSRDYHDFWDEMDKRNTEGYSVAGQKITGYHHFYLNFRQHPIVEHPKQAASRKIITFPRFWDIHQEFFWRLDDSEKAGKHFWILKPRGSGFSEIMATIAAHNYTLIPGSKSFFFAANEGYLIKDGVLTKCWDALNYLNQETERAYKHLRQVKDQDLHKRASELDPEGNEKGFKSEIIGRVIDHPRKVRGARTGTWGKVYFEEGGSFPRLRESVSATRPLVEQGGIVTAQIVGWGTGGETGQGIEGMEHIFYHPAAFNMFEFPNDWDESRVGTKCCWFFPRFAAMDRYMDNDGNCNQLAAKLHEEEERKKIKKSSPQDEDKYIAENPFSPQEALRRLSSNIFPIQALQEQLTRVQTDHAIQGFLKYGWIVSTDKGLKFRIDPSAKPIKDYPHREGEQLTGCMTQVESPWRDQLGHVPDELYQIVVDCYYKDTTKEGVVSLGAAYVYKHMNDITETDDDILVGWYVGRPGSTEEFYRNVLLLAKYYNAKIQSEIAGGGKGLYDYAKVHRSLQYLELEPDILYNNQTGTKKNKPYFMDMSTDRARLALIYLADWLKKERSVTEDKNTGDIILTMNLNKIYDEGLLQELIKFTDEGNFDRISAMRLLPFMIKEKIENAITRHVTDDFWSRPLFSDNPYYSNSNQLRPDEIKLSDDIDTQDFS